MARSLDIEISFRKKNENFLKKYLSWEYHPILRLFLEKYGLFLRKKMKLRKSPNIDTILEKKTWSFSETIEYG